LYSVSYACPLILKSNHYTGFKLIDT